MLHLLQRRKMVILLLAWPVSFALLLGAIFSSEVVSGLPFVVVDHDQSALSRTIIRYLDSTRSLSYRGQVESVHDIEALIHRDEIAFGLLIPRGLAGGIKRGRGIPLRAFVNGSNLMVANLSYSEIQTISGTISAGVMIRVLRKGGEEKDMALAHVLPVKSEIFRLFNPAYNYRLYLAPGLWLSVFHQLLILAGGMLLTRERKVDTASSLLQEEREGADGVMPELIGRLSPYIGVAALLHVVWYFLLLPLTGLPGGRSALAVEMLTLLFIFASLSLGLFIGAVARTRFQSLKVVILLTSPAFLISGYTWPLSAMPQPVQWFARCLPLTHYLSAFRKLYQEDAALFYVRWEMLALLIITGVALVSSWLLTRWRDERRQTPQYGTLP